MKIAVFNLSEAIREQEMLLRDESIASVRYGDDSVSGARAELTTVEAAAARRIQTAERIDDMRCRRDEMVAMVRTVDYALESLNDVDAELIRRHYIEGEKWENISNALFYSEKWARERAGKAMKDIALMIFGVQMRPAQLKLVLH